MSEIAERVKAIIVDKLSVNESEVPPGAALTRHRGADPLDAVEWMLQ